MVKILQITLLVTSFLATIFGGVLVIFGGLAQAPEPMAGGLITFGGGIFIMVKTLETMEDK